MHKQLAKYLNCDFTIRVYSIEKKEELEGRGGAQWAEDERIVQSSKTKILSFLEQVFIKIDEFIIFESTNQ